MARDLKLHTKQLRRTLRFFEEEKLVTRDHRKEVHSAGSALWPKYDSFHYCYLIAVCFTCVIAELHSVVLFNVFYIIIADKSISSGL